MKKERSIIQVIQSVDPILNAHLDSLNMGTAPYKEPAVYQNVETGDRYLYLAGGIGWPWKGFPGFVVVVAVSKMPGEEVDAPLFTCLEELEDDEIDGLLDGCIRLRDRYGFRQSDNLFQTWHGDPNLFSTDVTRFDLKLMKETEKVDGVYLAAPYDFEKSTHFDLYRRRIRSLGKSKALIATKCPSLLNRLRALPEDQETGEFPAVIALGGVVCTLPVTVPWTVRTRVGANIDSWEEYALSEGAAWQGKPFRQNVTDCT